MATLKLTDAQRVILATAGSRETCLVLPLPRPLGNNRGTLGVILKSLLTRGLVTERTARPDEEVWRETEELGRTTLVISAEGLHVMGIEPIEQVAGQHIEGYSNGGSGSPEQSREEEIGTNIQVQDIPEVARPKEGTKLGAMIAALSKPEGATIEELKKATGWQAHSVRGAISSNLKKKLNLEVTSETVENRGRVYHIATMGSAV